MELSLPVSLSAFLCSTQFLNRLNEAHPHWGGPSALLCLPIQILISPGYILTDTPRRMFNQIYVSWTIKKAEHQRISAFELWCWRRLLTVHWTARSSNQSILQVSPECSLEGLMQKLKLQYFGHLIGRTNLFEKTLFLGKIEGRRGRGQQRMRWFNGITDSMDMSLSNLQIGRAHV